MLLGAHLSIIGGLDQALVSAKKIKANTLQIFSGPPRNWSTSQVTSHQQKKFRRLAKKFQISPVFIHAKYLVNLSSDNPIVQDKSINSLVNDLNLANEINSPGVIFHPHPKNLNQLIKSINQVLTNTPKTTFLILENSSQMKLEEIGEIIKDVKSKRIKFCFDIAHAWQAGYDLTTLSGLKKIFQVIKSKISFNRWIVIHANDSKTGRESHHDQHQDIGQGQLGTIPFIFLLNHPISSKLPFILETPAIKTEGLAGDIRNLEMLRKLANQKPNQFF